MKVKFILQNGYETKEVEGSENSKIEQLGRQIRKLAKADKWIENKNEAYRARDISVIRRVD